MDNNGRPVEDKGSFGWAVLGFFIPLVGLILFLTWKNDKPKSAKKAGIGAIVGAIAGLILPAIISALFYFAIWPGVQANIVDQTCKTYGSEYKAVSTEIENTGQYNWCCCKDGSTNCSSNNPSCIIMSEEE